MKMLLLRELMEAINPPEFTTAKSSMEKDNEPEMNGSEGVGTSDDAVAELKFLRTKDIGDTLTPEQQMELDELRSDKDECTDPECCSPDCPTHGEGKRLGDMKSGPQRGPGMSSDTLRGIGEGFDRADDDTYNPRRHSKLTRKAQAAMANKVAATKKEEEVVNKPVKREKMAESVKAEKDATIAKIGTSVLATLDFKFGSSKK